MRAEAGARLGQERVEITPRCRAPRARTPALGRSLGGRFGQCVQLLELVHHEQQALLRLGRKVAHESPERARARGGLACDGFNLRERSLRRWVASLRTNDADVVAECRALDVPPRHPDLQDVSSETRLSRNAPLIQKELDHLRTIHTLHFVFVAVLRSLVILAWLSGAQSLDEELSSLQRLLDSLRTNKIEVDSVRGLLDSDLQVLDQQIPNRLGLAVGLSVQPLRFPQADKLDSSLIHDLRITSSQSLNGLADRSLQELMGLLNNLTFSATVVGSVTQHPDFDSFSTCYVGNEFTLSEFEVTGRLEKRAHRRTQSHRLLFDDPSRGVPSQRLSADPEAGTQLQACHQGVPTEAPVFLPHVPAACRSAA